MRYRFKGDRASCGKVSDQGLCESILDLIDDPEIDAVDICLPHFLHARVALEAVAKKKHVLIEKPFATNLDQADEIISGAKRNNLKLDGCRKYQVCERLPRRTKAESTPG